MRVRGINHQKLSNRLVQLSGYSAKRLRPIHLFEASPNAGGGQYNPGLHGITLDSSLKNIRHHEERHGGQMLIGPHDMTKIKITDKHLAELATWAEISNPGISKIHDIAKAAATRAKYSLSSQPRILRFLSAIRSTKGVTYFDEMVKKHGEDGILLAWAEPPLNINGAPDALFFKQWESYMVAKGILQPNGGFTPKGEKYFQQKTKPRIRKRLTAAEQERQKQRHQLMIDDEWNVMRIPRSGKHE